MTTENELLWCQLSKINLVFGGIPDSDKETNNDLCAKISNVIKYVTGSDIQFDTAYRVGKPTHTGQRPVKVRFLSMYDRNLIYESRFKASRPTFINEDLPFSMRRDHGLMRQRRKALIDSGFAAKQIKMDWNKKMVSTKDVRFVIKDGKYHEEPNHQGMSSSHSQQMDGWSQRSNSSHSGPKAFGGGVGDHHQRPISGEKNSVPTHFNFMGNSSAKQIPFQTSSVTSENSNANHGGFVGFLDKDA